MRRTLASVLLLTVAATPLAAQADSAGHRISFQPPMSVAGFRMTEHEVLDEPGAGAHLRYERPGQPAWIDVYVYPVHADSGCARGCDSLAVQRESDDFAGLIPELLRRGYYDSLRVERDQPVSMGPRYGRHLVLRGGREGQQVISHFYLVSGGQVLVKVRATYPPDASLDAAVDEFARGFVEGALRTVDACTAGDANRHGLSMSVSVATPLDSVRTRVRPALERLGYTVEEEGDIWVTQPVRAWPASELWGMLRDKPHPGLQVMVQVSTEGGKTKLEVSARTLCVVPGQADLANSVPLIAAMEVMAQFPEAKP
jgi:hypothetical protein